MPSQTINRTGHRTIREALTVLTQLKTIGIRTRPPTYRVVFRSLDGSVGRRDFATHCIHRYPAKMFHRIPRAILESFSESEPLVILDPFCGSGTVMLEAILAGHHAIGIDVNPLARLIAAVKTTPVAPAHLKRHRAGVFSRARKSLHASEPNQILDYWFKPNIRASLEKIVASLVTIEHPECRAFFEIALSSIVRRASLADPSVPPPVKLKEQRAKRANRKYKIDLNRALNLTSADVFELFEQAVNANLSRMRELVEIKTLGIARVLPYGAEASNTGLPSKSIDLILTSPPYCGAQKYVRSLRLEMLLLGIDEKEIANVDRKTLGTERVSRSKTMQPLKTRFPFANRILRKIFSKNPTRATMLAHYVNYLDEFAEETKRVLKPGGNAFVTFGTVRLAKITVDGAQIFARIATHHGLRHVATLVDSIPSRGLMTIRHSTAGTIEDERVVWLKSEEMN